MKRTIELLNQEFISSSVKTDQYLTYHKLFKSEFTKFLVDVNCYNVQIDKPNHFDISGFFSFKDKYFYFSLDDLRDRFKFNMLIRECKGYKDYTGYKNHFARLDLENFINDFSAIVL